MRRCPFCGRRERWRVAECWTDRGWMLKASCEHLHETLML